jgi:acyl carrier protein
MMQVTTAVLEDVSRIVAEVLAVEAAEVRPDVLFFDQQLDGDSLALLELSFRLEKHFRVRVKFNDLTGDDIELDEQGRLTPSSLALLKSKYPFLKLEGYESRPLERRTDLLTIEAIAGFVQMALDSRAAATVAESLGDAAGRAQ